MNTNLYKIFYLIYTFIIIISIYPESNKEYKLKGLVRKVITEEATFSEKFGKWIESEKRLYSEENYNNAGDLKEEISYLYIPYPVNRYSIFRKYIYSYDSNGNLTEESRYNGDGTLTEKFIYTYDENGNRKDWTGYDADGKQYFKFLYSYDNNGKLTEESWINSNGQKVDYKDLYIYDANGKLKLSGHSSLDGSAFLPQFGYTYDVHGYRIERLYNWNNGRFLCKDIYIYDNNYNLIEEQYSALQQRILYSYDDKGNWIRKSVLEYSFKFGKQVEEPKKVVYRKIEYFQ